MDQHFHFDELAEDDDPLSPAERIGMVSAAIFFIGLAILIALCLVALGIAAVRWAL